MRAGHDLRRAESKAHGGILEQDGIFIGPCGNGDTQSLGQDNGTYALHVRHAERAARLKLPRGQALNGAAKYLGLISRAGQTEHGAGGTEKAAEARARPGKTTHKVPPAF